MAIKTSYLFPSDYLLDLTVNILTPPLSLMRSYQLLSLA